MERQTGQSEPSIIVTDEQGEEKEMIVVYTFSVQDSSYAVLLEKEDPEKDGVLMKVEEEEDNTYLAPIEDDEEWDHVVSVYEEIVNREQE